MTKDVRKRWLKALALAGCPCAIGGPAVRSPADDWALHWEFWNTYDNGHAVLASLTLDGIACEDLP